MIETGETLEGKYRIERLLGQGGMGSVYLATHLGTDRPVAIKVIAPRFLDNEEFIERFRREARAAGRLRHPNVVNVTDFGSARTKNGEVAYLVMEYLDGCTLAERLQQESYIPLVTITEILEQTCSALDEAHARGIVHRDLKPENLWLQPDRRGGFTVKVLDFGLAKLADSKELRAEPFPHPIKSDVSEMETVAVSVTQQKDLTTAGFVMGTPRYMSPEQCRGESPDARGDIYSLGVITYRMLAGSTPFSGDTYTIIQKHLNEPPPDLRKSRSDISRAVSSLVNSALEKDPEKRPQSAGSFAAAFKARAEPTAIFLQVVLMVASARLTQLLKMSLLSLSPMILLSLALLGTHFIPEIQPRPFGLAHIFLIFTFLIAILLNSAFSEPLVLHYLAQQDRALSFKLLIQGIRGRIGAYIITLLQYLVFWPLYTLAAYTIIATDAFGSIKIMLAFSVISLLFVAYLLRNIGAFIFAPQVILLEGLRGKEALDRSSALVKEAGKNLRNKFFAANMQTTILATIAGLILVHIHSWTKIPLSHLHGYAALGVLGLLSIPVLMHVLPFFSVPLAILYFRIREAAGEPLDGVLALYSKRVLTEPGDNYRRTV